MACGGAYKTLLYNSHNLQTTQRVHVPFKLIYLLGFSYAAARVTLTDTWSSYSHFWISPRAGAITILNAKMFLYPSSYY